MTYAFPRIFFKRVTSLTICQRNCQLPMRPLCVCVRLLAKPKMLLNTLKRSSRGLSSLPSLVVNWLMKFVRSLQSLRKTWTNWIRRLSNCRQEPIPLVPTQMLSGTMTSTLLWKYYHPWSQCWWQCNSRRKAKIEEFKMKIAKETEELEARTHEIAELKETWLPKVKHMASQINERFGQFFKDIGCLGEVGLLEAPNEDFDNYGLQISVSYRRGQPVQPLNAHVQSGGERSVATMLFLISLQAISDSPFRLVDEINQVRLNCKHRSCWKSWIFVFAGNGC